MFRFFIRMNELFGHPIQNTYTYKELQEHSFFRFFSPHSPGVAVAGFFPLVPHTRKLMVGFLLQFSCSCTLWVWPSLMAKTQIHEGTHNHVLTASSDFYSPPWMSVFIYSSESSGSCFIYFVQNFVYYAGWEMVCRKLILIS